MSWFSTGLHKLNQITAKVQKAIPVDKEMLAKLTLNTDEMKAERLFFGEEQQRKAAARDRLAGMFPWETRDPERDILVEECKEAILALSHKEATFFGPYEIPPMDVKKVDDEDKEDDEDDDDEVQEPITTPKVSSSGEASGDGDEKTNAEEGTDETESVEDENVHKPIVIKDQKPSKESLEKLAKLEPLPPLLQDFDLDSYVGLIQKLLKADPQLVKMQSNLSGGGEREKVFWRNYFFHCAFTRYEAGLSIDEIWSFPSSDPPQSGVASTGVTNASGVVGDIGAEETVVFDETSGPGDSNEIDGATASEAAFAPDSTLDATGGGGGGGAVDSSVNGSGESVDDISPSSEPGDFELVGDSDNGIIDAELDELEAEIARELED